MGMEDDEPDNITAGSSDDMFMVYAIMGCGGCGLFIVAFIVIALLVKLGRWAFF